MHRRRNASPDTCRRSSRVDIEAERGRGGGTKTKRGGKGGRFGAEGAFSSRAFSRRGFGRRAFSSRAFSRVQPRAALGGWAVEAGDREGGRGGGGPYVHDAAAAGVLYARRPAPLRRHVVEDALACPPETAACSRHRRADSAAHRPVSVCGLLRIENICRRKPPRVDVATVCSRNRRVLTQPPRVYVNAMCFRNRRVLP